MTVQPETVINAVDILNANEFGYVTNGSRLHMSDKFDSGFDPWGDYLFGSFMILVGKLDIFLIN